jgi:branched-chain amino acid transport system permease protein
VRVAGPRIVFVLALLAAFALVPLVAKLTGFPFLMTLFTRVLILAIAAVSLNFILGYAGLISLGHAVYIGIGGYTVGILAHHGIYSGLVQWPLAIGLSGLFALATGALSLRTRGVYFLMITLAFAQMFYFLTVGLEQYGGDDGLTIHRRSTFGGVVDLTDKASFYYVCLLCLVVCVMLVWRMSLSHFGMVVQGSRSNDTRMRALGISTYRYRLAAFVIAGTMCGLAGALLANHTDFISPEMLSWTRSGDLIIMVVVGGVGTVLGPVVGTAAYLVLEEVLARFSEHWQILFGLLLVLMALFKRGGIAGLLSGRMP